MFSTWGGGLNREGGLNKSEGFIRGWIIYEGGGLSRESTVCAPSPFQIFMAKCH